jgi:hypothetical protein
MSEAELSESDLALICDIARRRAALIDQLQEALERNDTLLALELAREVCGMPQEAAQ